MYKIILVDDETRSLRIFSKIIEKNSIGFTLAAAFESAEEAIEYLKTEHVDVIISDIAMPGMSGLEFLEYVKNIDSDIIFIILSAYKDFDYVKFALKHKAAEYLTKPVNQEELRQLMYKIKERLDKRGSDLECNYTELKCQQALIDYMSGNKISADMFSSVMSDYGIEVSCSQTPIAIIHTGTSNTDELMNKFAYGTDRLHTALMQLFRMNNIPVLSMNYSISSMNIIIFSSENSFENFSDNLEKTLNEFKKNCTQLLSIDITAHINGIYHSLDEARPKIMKILNISHNMNDEKIYNEHIISVINYIKANYKNDISLSDAAGYVHITPFHLSKLFKKVTGRSFITYVNDYRIETAKDLLTSTIGTVTEISEQAGFRNITNFYRTFRKSTGMSPQEYRNSYK